MVNNINLKLKKIKIVYKQGGGHGLWYYFKYIKPYLIEIIIINEDILN